jgi:hypothetical protein
MNINDFDGFLPPELDTTFWYLNATTIPFIRPLTAVLLGATSYCYIFLKFYRVLCFSKLTFEWLPMLNPYQWPFSFFRTITAPYFDLWAKILPSIRLPKSSIQISGVVALEAINCLIFLCIRITENLVPLLEEMDKIIKMV